MDLFRFCALWTLAGMENAHRGRDSHRGPMDALLTYLRGKDETK